MMASINLLIASFVSVGPTQNNVFYLWWKGTQEGNIVENEMLQKIKK